MVRALGLGRGAAPRGRRGRRRRAGRVAVAARGAGRRRPATHARRRGTGASAQPDDGAVARAVQPRRRHRRAPHGRRRERAVGGSRRARAAPRCPPPTCTPSAWRSSRVLALERDDWEEAAGARHAGARPGRPATGSATTAPTRARVRRLGARAGAPRPHRGGARTTCARRSRLQAELDGLRAVVRRRASASSSRRAALRLSDPASPTRRLAPAARILDRAPEAAGLATRWLRTRSGSSTAFARPAARRRRSMTTAELRILRLPADAPLVPRDRRADVRVGEHGQDAGQRGLPQARRVLPLGRGRPRPSAAACWTADARRGCRPPPRSRPSASSCSAPSPTRSHGWIQASASPWPPAAAGARRAAGSPSGARGWRRRRDCPAGSRRRRTRPRPAGGPPSAAASRPRARRSRRPPRRPRRGRSARRRSRQLGRTRPGTGRSSRPRRSSRRRPCSRRGGRRGGRCRARAGASARRRLAGLSSVPSKLTTSICMGPNGMAQPSWRIFCFSAWNSASVSTPASSRPLSCVRAAHAVGGRHGRGRRGRRPAPAERVAARRPRARRSLLGLRVGELLVLLGLVLLVALHVLAGGVRGTADHGGPHERTATTTSGMCRSPLRQLQSTRAYVCL